MADGFAFEKRVGMLLCFVDASMTRPLTERGGQHVEVPPRGVLLESGHLHAREELRKNGGVARRRNGPVAVCPFVSMHITCTKSGRRKKGKKST